MLDSLSTLWKFLNYWYFRYLMVTELYMVEKWERAVCNITILIVLCSLTYMNCKVLSYASNFWSSGSGNFSEMVPST